MSVKRAFFSVFQKFMVFCCAIFFGIANAFSANLPSGYTELEYIESTGTQYIDTGLINTDIKKITFTYEISNDTNVNDITFYGVITGANGYAPVSFVSDNSAVRALWINNKSSVSATKLQGKHTIIQETSPATLYIDNNLQTLSSDSNTKTGNLSLFASKYGAAAKYGKMKLYFCDIETVNTSKRNMIPAKRNSDNVIGMYDTVTGTFFTNAGTGTFIAGPVVPENPIRIATTAYNSARFNPVVTELNSTIATIRDVVTNTINQTKAIADLQATKQTRPADDYTDETNTENCPKFRQCLLVEDNNNIPHWYLIKDPVRDLVTSLRDNKINSAGATTTTTYAANGYDGANYYKGYAAMRKLADGSTAVNTRQFGAALTGGDNGGQYKTLSDQEWAVTWDGAETGTAGSFMSGVIYGTSRCSKVKPSSTAVGTEGWNTIENSDPVNDAENIQSYVQCYCKMTGVGVDGEFTPVWDSSRAPWVFANTYGSAASCAHDCAPLCAINVRGYAAFRSAVLGFAAN